MNPNVVDDGEGKYCSSCIIDNGCTKEFGGNAMKCDKCKGVTHFECTGLPTYLLFLFSSKGYKRFRCKKCVGNVPHEFDRYTKSETIDEDNMIAMRRELGDKDEVIASLKVAHDTLKKLSDDKNSLIENQEKIIETIQKAGANGTNSEDLEQVAKDTIIKEQQLVVGALKSELVNAQGSTEDVKKKFDKKFEVFMKESDRTVLQKEEKLAATLIELDKSDTSSKLQGRS